MNRWLLLVIAFVGLTVLGCSNDDVSEEKPPQVFVEIDDKTYETLLGTYCWGNTCVDTIGPVEMLEDEESIPVKPGEIISLTMNYEPKPNEFYVVQMSKDGEKIGAVQDNWFTAPSEQGVYYYYYSVGWMDEEVEHLSHGDAFYAFALEVGL